MNTDAAEALQALCPMRADEARNLYRRTGRVPDGWQLVKRQCGEGLDQYGVASVDWAYATTGFDNHDIICRKPILTEAP